MEEKRNNLIKLIEDFYSETEDLCAKFNRDLSNFFKDCTIEDGEIILEDSIIEQFLEDLGDDVGEEMETYIKDSLDTQYYLSKKFKESK